GVYIRLLGTRWGAVTNEAGKFEVMDVAPGAYTLEASRLGYQKQQRERLVVQADSTTRVNFEMAEVDLSLKEIVVTPGSFDIMREESAAQQTLSREDIQSIPQFGEDIYRAVKRLPGIASNDYSARFTVRGGEHNEVLVLLDGLELYEPFHLKDINGGGLSIIDVQAIGGITLMTGGFPAEFGNRLSGVFNITSASPSATRRRTSLGISFLNARFMSEGTFADNKGQWLFSARRGYLDLVMDLVDPESNFRPTYYDVLSKVEYRLSRAHTLGFNILHAGDHVDFEEDGSFAATNYGNSYAWLTLKSFLSTKLFAQTVASVGRVTQDREGRDTYNNATQIRAEVNDARAFYVYALKQDWTYSPNARHLLKWGAGLKELRAEYDYFNREQFRTATAVGYDSVALALAPRGQIFNAFVAKRLRLTSAWTIELGLRYDRASYTDGEHISPRLNFAYALGANTTLRAGWGKFWQEQGIHELQVEDGDGDFHEAELAEHRVLGLERQFHNGVNLRLEGYHKKLAQLRPRYYNLAGELEFFPEVAVDRVRLLPAGGEAKGLEIFLKRDLNGKLSWWGSYAWARVADRVTGREVVRNFDQRHTLYLDLTYRPSSRWRLNLAWQYHTGWPVTPARIERVSGPDGIVQYQTIYGDLNTERY
ncbi:MAG: TonB-dependent receptor, partial [candidate division KSB1 bacterium]